MSIILKHAIYIQYNPAQHEKLYWNSYKHINPAFDDISSVTKK